jgi:hypothetical protein
MSELLLNNEMRSESPKLEPDEEEELRMLARSALVLRQNTPVTRINVVRKASNDAFAADGDISSDSGEAADHNADEALYGKKRPSPRWTEEECQELIRIYNEVRQERGDNEDSGKAGGSGKTTVGQLSIAEWQEVAKRLRNSGVSPIQRTWCSVYGKWLNLVERGIVHDEATLASVTKRKEKAARALRNTSNIELDTAMPSRKRTYLSLDHEPHNEDVQHTKRRHASPGQNPDSNGPNEQDETDNTEADNTESTTIVEHPRNGSTRADIRDRLRNSRKTSGNLDAFAIESAINALVLMAAEHRQDLLEVQASFRADMLAMHQRQRDEDREREERIWSRIMEMEKQREQAASQREAMQQKAWRELFDQQSRLHMEMLIKIAGRKFLNDSMDNRS